MQRPGLRLLLRLIALIILLADAMAVPVSPNTAELKDGWRLESSWNVVQDGRPISQPSYDDSKWHKVASMPATVLQILQEDGTYPNLYFGKNLTEKVPRDHVREGKSAVHFEQRVTLAPGEFREVSFAPDNYPHLIIAKPDLWWPYQWGPANLYGLKLQFQIGARTSDAAQIRFGIRKITQQRDSDNSFPQLGGGGNCYLQVNGIDYLVRGADYAPDLLYKYDENREESILRYVKDMA